MKTWDFHGHASIFKAASAQLIFLAPDPSEIATGISERITGVNGAIKREFEAAPQCQRLVNLRSEQAEARAINAGLQARIANLDEEASIAIAAAQPGMTKMLAGLDAARAKLRGELVDTARIDGLVGSATEAANKKLTELERSHKDREIAHLSTEFNSRIQEITDKIAGMGLGELGVLVGALQLLQRETWSTVQHQHSPPPWPAIQTRIDRAALGLTPATPKPQPQPAMVAAEVVHGGDFGDI